MTKTYQEIMEKPSPEETEGTINVRTQSSYKTTLLPKKPCIFVDVTIGDKRVAFFENDGKALVKMEDFGNGFSKSFSLDDFFTFIKKI